MTTTHRLFPGVFLAVLSLVLVGCQTTESAKAPRKRMINSTPPCAAPQAPGIYLTGMALRGPRAGAEDQFIDYTKISAPGIRVPSGLCIVSNHDVRWCLHGDLPEGTGAFQVVMGPAQTGELYAEGCGKNPIIMYLLKKGWAFLTGNAPTGESDWGSGSASGTQWALRIPPEIEPSGHYFYNLEPAPALGMAPAASSYVYVRGGWLGDPVAVPPQQRVVLTGARMTEAPEPEDFTAEDLAFIAFMRERVAAAQVEYRE